MHTKSNTIRLGRISYLNVLPICHPLENGIVPNNYAITRGAPSELNQLMARGELDVSAMSSIEYARRPGKYRLVPDLAIGAAGPVMSVLLLSRRPPRELAGEKILVSSQTHTSAALLKLLFSEHLGIKVEYENGWAGERMDQRRPPRAVLAIGDQALSLRNHPAYPYRWDLGLAWKEWTGLPFIFGLWAVRRDLAHTDSDPCEPLVMAKSWSRHNMRRIIEVAAASPAKPANMNLKDLEQYFKGLVYDLGAREMAGLRLFYERLADMGEIERAPELVFHEI